MLKALGQGEQATQAAPEAALSPWRVLANMAGWRTGASPWMPVAYVSNEKTDSQVPDKN